MSFHEEIASFSHFGHPYLILITTTGNFKIRAHKLTHDTESRRIKGAMKAQYNLG